MDAIDPQASRAPVYLRESRPLHYLPVLLLIVAAIPLAFGNAGVALLFGVPAMVVSVLLPWRFAVFGSGIALWFGFGKHRFLPREAVTIRAGLGSPVVLPRGADRFGYPLIDGPDERNRGALRVVLAENGFDLTE